MLQCNFGTLRPWSFALDQTRPPADVQTGPEGVALVALLDAAAGPTIVGGGRYIVSEPGRAEIAFGVDDAHQGQGIASALMRHLVGIAREAGLKELVAEVLPDNAPMLRVLERSGLAMTVSREPWVVRAILDLPRRDAGPRESAG
jgi:RimJ/RimL family protein N-acetyltransferase